MSREKGTLTPGLCIVADSLTSSGAYELAHHRPRIESIKVRPKSFVGASLEETERLRDGDFHVVCDGKFYFSRTDEMNDMLELFARRSLLPDAVTYAPYVGRRIMSELVKEMADGIYVHTIVLSAFLPEQVEYTDAERLDYLKNRIELAHQLVGEGGRVAIYGAAADLVMDSLDVPEGILTLGAGIRELTSDVYLSLDDAIEGGVDIPLIASVMGEELGEIKKYFDNVAPLSA